jgi:hypothetical protein
MQQVLNPIAILGLYLLSPLAVALGADIADFSLIPNTGNVTGPAGSTVGWGYSLTNESTTDWLVTVGVDSGAFLDSTPLLIFDFPILGPETSVSVPYDANIPAGIFALAWDNAAPEGFTNTGDFTLSDQWWDGDPLNGGSFIADGLDLTQPYSATVSAASAGVPEPSSGSLVTAGLLLFFLVRLSCWSCFATWVRACQMSARRFQWIFPEVKKMRNRFLWGLVLFGLFIIRAHGSTITDPQIQVRDAGESGGGGPGTVTVFNQAFTVVTPTGNSPTDSPCIVNGFSDQACDLINDSGQNWTTLTIDINPGQSFDSCAVLDFFAACQFIQHGGGGMDSIVYVYGGGGLPNGQAFGFSFLGWAAGTQLTASANAVAIPEPASSTLIVVACALMAIRARCPRLR